MNRTLLAAALGIAMLPLTGCGDGGTGPGAAGFGSGSVQVTGAVNLSFSGFAIAETDAAFGSNAYVIAIEDNSGENDVGLVFIGGRPGTGTHTIGNPNSPIYGELGVGPDLYESLTGQVTITSSSSERVQGSMSFTARRLGGQQQVTVTGNFNATCIVVPGLFTCE